MSSFSGLILLIAGWLLVDEAALEISTERLITAADSTYLDFAEELGEFSVAGDLMYNLTLKSLTGQPVTSVLRTYIDLRASQLKGDIFLLENRILQCQLKSVTSTLNSTNGTFFENVKRKLKSIKQDLQLRWGVPENFLLSLIMLNLIIHVYTLSFVLRIRTYKKLVRK